MSSTNESILQSPYNGEYFFMNFDITTIPKLLFLCIGGNSRGANALLRVKKQAERIKKTHFYLLLITCCLSRVFICYIFTYEQAISFLLSRSADVLYSN